MRTVYVVPSSLLFSTFIVSDWREASDPFVMRSEPVRVPDQRIMWFLDMGWMVFPVACSNRQGGGEKSIRLHAWARACVGETVPQTITEGATVLGLFTVIVRVPIYMIEVFALRQPSVP